MTDAVMMPPSVLEELTTKMDSMFQTIQRLETRLDSMDIGKIMSMSDIHNYYPHLTIAQIESAIAYYEDYPEEIEAEFAEEERYLREELPRVQQLRVE